MNNILKSKSEKQRDRNLNTIKGAVRRLRADGFTIESETVETMTGAIVTHIYARLRSSCGRLYEQKHLFTLNEFKKEA